MAGSLAAEEKRSLMSDLELSMAGTLKAMLAISLVSLVLGAGCGSDGETGGSGGAAGSGGSSAGTPGSGGSSAGTSGSGGSSAGTSGSGGSSATKDCPGFLEK